MTLVHTFAVLRDVDHAVLGHVAQGDAGFESIRTCIIREAPDAEHMSTLPTLDAAVAWVRDNPLVPDPAIAPNHDGVFGPLLTRLGDVRVVGVVHTYAVEQAAGVGNAERLQRSLLVAIDASGTVVARLGASTDGWAMILATGTKPVTRTRKSWPAALSLFGQLVVQHACAGSGHEKMHMLEQAAAMDQDATRFKDGQAALRALPGAVSPGFYIEGTNVLRDTDMFFLGKLWCRNGATRADRIDPGGIKGSGTFDSLDEAVAWLGQSPHAPDLDRFPFHTITYGPVLWITPKCIVVGSVGDTTPFSSTANVLYLLDRTQNTLGILSSRTGAMTHFLMMHKVGRTQLAPMPSESDALDAVFKEILDLHSTTQARGLERGVPKARERITAFLRDRPQLIAQFRAGRGPHPAAS